MSFEQCWRWFGPKDPVSLQEVKQTGAVGAVTALHHIPQGEIWSKEEITRRHDQIKAAGLKWSVVESLPVHEKIKYKGAGYNELIDNYKQSLRNLGNQGISYVCYNFMPVLDWSRTNLQIQNNDGAQVSGFEPHVLAAFDLFLLKRAGAETDYPEDVVARAESFFKQTKQTERDRLLETILLGLPGSLEAFSLESLSRAMANYKDIGEAELKANLKDFLKEVIPVAEEAGVFLVIHPDDPPRPLLGLPRIVKNSDDLKSIIHFYDSPANGLTFCTGSLGAGYHNDLAAICEEMAHRINFVHLRNLKRSADGSFYEDYHLKGDLDLYELMRILLQEQGRRVTQGRTDIHLPMRPDHGLLLDRDKRNNEFYPGYSYIGRLMGLAELRGLEQGVIRNTQSRQP
ncbi:MAG: mannonate dehydratase [Spirochaetales bacterium]|nr:mannonate dehydratase [Spirochaetales bacterium]